MDDLQKRWRDLTTFLSDENREKWWHRIISAYENRPFRGLDHLIAMLKMFDQHKDCLKDRYATAFAVFFKNIVCVPLATDNAEKSAQMVREFAQDTTFDAENYVVELIQASGSSTTEAHLNADQTGSEDLHFLIDFDMAFLGDDPERFAEHERAQRKEYAHLSDEEYAKMREKILRFFLQVPNIFATKEMRAELEQKARANIEREIARLATNHSY